MAANALLLAYGFSQKKSVILLLACLLPVAAVAAYMEIMTQAIPVVYIAIKLERELLPHRETLITTFAEIRLDPLFAPLINAANVDDSAIRESILSLPRWRWLEKRIPILACGVCIVELSLFLISLTTPAYRFM